jgi:hypothetical protein
MRVVLLGLLGLAVLGTELPDVHTHDAETPGFYNQECPLARLGVPGWGLPALARETLPQPDPHTDPASPRAYAQAARATQSPFAPRAPPTIS